jgi:hypothetical protein
MRVLLLFPKLNNLVFFGVYEPLVMEIFSAIAKEEGCEVELVDMRLYPRGAERLTRRSYVPDLIALTTHGRSSAGKRFLVAIRVFTLKKAVKMTCRAPLLSQSDGRRQPWR